jgi:hypothetical protein
VIAVSLSAFNYAPKQSAKPFSVLNYWAYNPSTQQLGASLGSFDPATQQEDLEAVSCPDNGSIECARGYTSSTKPTTQIAINNFQDNVAHQ